jgi:anti-sigma-K factor RskA
MSPTGRLLAPGLAVLALAISVPTFVAGFRGWRDVAALRAEVAALGVRVAAFGERTPSTGPVLRQLIALESRVAALEAAGPRGNGIDLEELQAALKEIRAMERAERTRVHVRQRLAQHGVTLPPEEEEAVVAVVSRYTGALLAVREEPTSGGPAMRYAGAIEARERMVRDLRALLPPVRAQEVIDLYPPPPAPAAPSEEDGGGD